MSVTKVSSPMIESGTKGADIASAATVVIGTDGSYFDITGTTGISTQFTVDAGRRFTLQFDGAVTITDNAAITLSGAANFTTAAGDILSFVAVAANTVVQTGYSLVDGGSPISASTGNFKFLACLSSDNANKLGDGATWNTSDGTNSWTEIYDEGSGFSAGTWTAPSDAGGKYIICVNIFMAGITTSHDQIKISIRTSNRSYLPVLNSDPGDYFNTSDGSLSHTGAVIADVDAGDTITARVWISGGSQVVDLKGNGTTDTAATFFSGALLA